MYMRSLNSSLSRLCKHVNLVNQLTLSLRQGLLPIVFEIIPLYCGYERLLSALCHLPICSVVPLFGVFLYTFAT